MNENSLRNFIKIVFGVGLAIIVTIIFLWVYFDDKRYEIRITEAQLQEEMQKTFPFSKSYLLFLNIEFKNPRLKIDPKSGRVYAGMDVELHILKDENKKTLTGRIDLNSKIFFNPEQHTFYLSEPVLDRLSIPGLPEKWREKTENLVTKAMIEYYKEQPVYTLTSTNIKTTTAKLLLKSFKIEGTTIVVELGI